MAIEVNNSQPQQGSQPAPVPPPVASPTTPPTTQSSGKGKYIIIGAIIFVVILIFIGIFLSFYKGGSDEDQMSDSELIVNSICKETCEEMISLEVLREILGNQDLVYYSIEEQKEIIKTKQGGVCDFVDSTNYNPSNPNIAGNIEINCKEFQVGRASEIIENLYISNSESLEEPISSLGLGADSFLWNPKKGLSVAFVLGDDEKYSFGVSLIANDLSQEEKAKVMKELTEELNKNVQ